MTANDPTATQSDALDAATGILDASVALAHELRVTVHDQLQLVVLESERAVHSLVVMLAAQVAIGTLLVSTWLSLIGAGVLALISAGLGPTLALIVAAGMTLVGVLVPYRIIQYQRRHLRFPATLASLTASPTGAAKS
jgi:hypothetical protein